MEVPVTTVSPAMKKIVILITFVCFVGVSVALITVGALLDNEIVPPKAEDNTWRNHLKYEWKCINNTCEKTLITFSPIVPMQSHKVCQITCNDFGNMWPQPTGEFSMAKKLTAINRSQMNISLIQPPGPATMLMSLAISRFQAHIQRLERPYSDIGKAVNIRISIQDLNVIDLTLDTNEGYKLEITQDTMETMVNVKIESDNFFGARHALETLENFIIFDEMYSEILIPTQLTIVDEPFYPYRGLSLDTARNFYSIASIKRTLDAMAACKLNRFHWHLTDTNSFPFMSKSYPELTEYGAHSPSKIYYPEQIKEIVEFAKVRGISIIPEFDAPSHVGEGWQMTNYTVCFKIQPWSDYCLQPPCGQFDPTQSGLYDMLEGIYKDLIEAFQPNIFHMGGDEVLFRCWNDSVSITSWMEEKGWNATDEGFHKLWEYFQYNAQQRLYKANGNKKLPIMLWSSSLTELADVENYIDNDEYIIQYWIEKDDEKVKTLLKKGYKMVITNYDSLYLDCGFGAWVGEGNNWCSPYVGWNKVYNNSLQKIDDINTNMIIGGEVALWSEQSDSMALDARLWPRAGAFAEVLWAEPNNTWLKAENRMLSFREKLVDMGIAADALKPEWCYQNDGHCV